jgi:hypothetical protein
MIKQQQQRHRHSMCSIGRIDHGSFVDRFDGDTRDVMTLGALENYSPAVSYKNWLLVRES